MGPGHNHPGRKYSSTNTAGSLQKANPVPNVFQCPGTRPSDARGKAKLLSLQLVFSLKSKAPTYLPINRALFGFRDTLVDIKHTWDVQPQAVQVAPYHSPQLVEAWLAGLGDLETRKELPEPHLGRAHK